MQRIKDEMCEWNATRVTRDGGGKSKVIESYQLNYTKQMNIKRDYTMNRESRNAFELKY